MRFLLTLFIILILLPVHAQETTSIVFKESVTDDSALNQLFKQHYSGTITPEEIDTMQKVKVSEHITFIRGRLNNNLPEVIDKDFIVILLDRKAIINSLAFAEILNQPNTNPLLVGGVHYYRGLGHYYVYELHGKGFKKIFKSDAVVYNTSLGCESYENGLLHVVFRDINEDGENDLTFEGLKNYYCEENDSYRTSEIIVRTEKVIYQYLYETRRHTFVKIKS